MVCCSWRIVYNFVIVVDRETDSDGLINTEQMAEMVPTPWGFNELVGAININNMNWPDFFKASKLTWSSRTTLNPDDKRYGMILPAEIGALPKGVVDGGSFIRIVPIDVFVAWVGLDGKVRSELFAEEVSGVFETGGKGEGE